MERTLISDENQQYQYYMGIGNVSDIKHIKIETKYQGAKFPDAIQTKLDFFLNEREFQRLKEFVNSI